MSLLENAQKRILFWLFVIIMSGLAVYAVYQHEQKVNAPVETEQDPNAQGQDETPSQLPSVNVMGVNVPRIIVIVIVTVVISLAVLSFIYFFFLQRKSIEDEVVNENEEDSSSEPDNDGYPADFFRSMRNAELFENLPGYIGEEGQGRRLNRRGRAINQVILKIEQLLQESRAILPYLKMNIPEEAYSEYINFFLSSRRRVEALEAELRAIKRMSNGPRKTEKLYALLDKIEQQKPSLTNFNRGGNPPQDVY